MVRDITDLAAELHADLTKLLHEAEAYGDDPTALHPVRMLIGEVAALANSPEARDKVTVTQEPAAARPGPRYLIDLVTDCHEQLVTLVNALHTAGVSVAALAPFIEGIHILANTSGVLSHGGPEALRAVDEDDHAAQVESTMPHGTNPGERPTSLDFGGQELGLALARRNRGLPSVNPSAADQVAHDFMAQAEQARSKPVSPTRRTKPHTGAKAHEPKAQHRMKTARSGSSYSSNASER